MHSPENYIDLSVHRGAPRHVSMQHVCVSRNNVLGPGYSRARNTSIPTHISIIVPLRVTGIYTLVVAA